MRSIEDKIADPDGATIKRRWIKHQRLQDGKFAA